MSSNLSEVNTLLYDNKYGFNNNIYNFNKYWTWLCGNWKRFLAFKSQDFYRHSWSFRWIWVGVGHREIIMCSSEKGHSLVCTSMSNKAATPWAPRRGVYGTTRKWPFSPPQAAFTFCHHVTPDLARIDCNATCVPGLFVKRKQASVLLHTELPLASSSCYICHPASSSPSWCRQSLGSSGRCRSVHTHNSEALCCGWKKEAKVKFVAHLTPTFSTYLYCQ